jgi:hypothetical protein
VRSLRYMKPQSLSRESLVVAKAPLFFVIDRRAGALESCLSEGAMSKNNGDLFVALPPPDQRRRPERSIKLGYRAS